MSADIYSLDAHRSRASFAPAWEPHIGAKVRVRKTGARGTVMNDKYDRQRGTLWWVVFSSVAWHPEFFTTAQLEQDGEAA